MKYCMYMFSCICRTVSRSLRSHICLMISEPNGHSGVDTICTGLMIAHLLPIHIDKGVPRDFIGQTYPAVIRVQMLREGRLKTNKGWLRGANVALLTCPTVSFRRGLNRFSQILLYECAITDTHHFYPGNNVCRKVFAKKENHC